jgi:RNA polymerase sigma factor (sigma-70 family)
VTDPTRAIEAVWRIESRRLIASLARLVHDVGLAEDCAQDALLAAVEQWPRDGIPRNPGAWLMTAARRRAIDAIRRDVRQEQRYADLARLTDDTVEQPDPDDISDDQLRLVFIACHPVLSMDAQVALTLRMVGGLTTEEIARAHLVGESTVAQRIVRAKKALHGIPFELPPPGERVERLAAVLGVLYLIFNEGYAATSGPQWTRPDLCEEASRLGRILVGLAPREAEVHGLVALMELQASRLRARTGPEGEPIGLLDQDRARWDRLLIHRGLAALARAEELGGGAYTLQAAIAACHARALRADDTDWPRIAALYEQLARLTASPVVELNRAMALGMAYGPEAGLAIADALAATDALPDYHLLPSVRGDLLAKLGRGRDAAAEFARAAALTRNARERDVLLARAAKLEADHDS